MPLLEIKNKSNTPLYFEIRIKMGDGKTKSSVEVAKEANNLLKEINKDLQLK